MFVNLHTFYLLKLFPRSHMTTAIRALGSQNISAKTKITPQKWHFNQFFITEQISNSYSNHCIARTETLLLSTLGSYAASKTQPPQNLNKHKNTLHKASHEDTTTDVKKSPDGAWPSIALHYIVQPSHQFFAKFYYILWSNILKDLSTYS